MLNLKKWKWKWNCLKLDLFTNEVCYAVIGLGLCTGIINVCKGKNMLLAHFQLKYLSLEYTSISKIINLFANRLTRTQGY